MRSLFVSFHILILVSVAMTAACGSRDVNLGGEGGREEESALFKAIDAGKLDVVQQELSANPALLVTPQGSLQWTPLHKAAASDRVEIARFLLQNGAPPNAFDLYRQTPLTAAMDAGASEEMIGLIRQYGGDD